MTSVCRAHLGSAIPELFCALGISTSALTVIRPGDLLIGTDTDVGVWLLSPGDYSRRRAD